MSWKKKDDWVAVFAGAAGTDKELAKLAHVLGAWDENCQESGIGSYAFSYAGPVIKALYALGLPPEPSQVIHGYVPAIEPGPVKGMPEAIYVGAFQRNKLARDPNETRILRDKVHERAFDYGRLEVSTADGWNVLAREPLRTIRERRKELRKTGQETRVVKTPMKRAEAIRALQALQRREDMSCGIAYYLDDDKPLQGPYLTWSAREELERAPRKGEVAAWLASLQHESGEELVPETPLDVREHIAPDGTIAWTHSSRKPWILLVAHLPARQRP